MKQTIVLILALIGTSLTAQSLWTEVKESQMTLRSGDEVRTLPSHYKTYALDFDNIEKLARTAPHERITLTGKSHVEIALPMPDGSFDTFEVYYSPTMQSGIAAKYPHIRSYKGISINDPLTTVRFDFGDSGFHGAIHSPAGIFYIDPYAANNKDYYLTYNVKDDKSGLPDGIPTCGVDHEAKTAATAVKGYSGSREDIVPLRVYRLAIACTGEYGAWKGSVEQAMSDINTGVNRMNQVYENEASIRYVLVDRNDELLFFDALNDQYANTSSGGAMLSANTAIISGIIGVNAYDIGHVYHRACDVGGIASLGSLCANSRKGAGVTCHSNGNLDYFAVSVTAHEIGHQMDAQHTFNNCDEDNETLANGFEPGSGSTIMSYAGLCGPAKNVQNTADGYYHTGTLIQVYNHTRIGLGDTCGEKEDFGNHEPTITLPELYQRGLTIPENTAFYLQGAATDMDGDALTYAWDGMNAGPLSPLGSPIGEAPHFRAFPPSTNPVRYFPSMDNVFLNSFDRTEVMPRGSKTMKFNFTARDNNPTGGTAVWEEVKFDVRPTDEQWEITNATSGQSLAVGTDLTLEWNVAGTDQPPFNTKFVDIYLSDYRSDEFDINNLIPLAIRVPNDGVHTVSIPNVQTNRGRIVLLAHDNIYFDVYNFNIQVVEPTDTAVFVTADVLGTKLCIPDVIDIEISTTAFNTVEDIQLSVEGLPAEAVATFASSTVSSGETTILTLDFTNVLVNDLVTPSVVAMIPSVDTFARELSIELVPNDYSDLAVLTPTSGAEGVVGAPTFTWSEAQFADSYDFELSDSPLFDNIIQSSSGQGETTFVSEVVLDNSTVYYWRVRGNNSCGSGPYTKVAAFGTSVLACETYEATNLPLNITTSGTATLEVDFIVNVPGTVADVNIPDIRAEHDRVRDLSARLVSPDQTSVMLFDRICNHKNLNVSFDDEAANLVDCPLNAGDVYQPEERLSLFEGQQSAGTWTLLVTDNTPGNGGRIQEATLELCANVTVENPTISQLDILRAATSADTKIGNWTMRVTDIDTPDSDLTYTVVSVPQYGTLLERSLPISIGDQFTQVDINSLFIDYRAGADEVEDLASFVVTDGTGGWVGIFDLVIDVNANNPVATEDVDRSTQLIAYPNPTANFVMINTNGQTLVNANLIDIAGRAVLSLPVVNDGQAIDLSALETGIYTLTGNIGTNRTSTRIVVTK